jgi:hypothetical protein
MDNKEYICNILITGDNTIPLSLENLKRLAEAAISLQEYGFNVTLKDFLYSSGESNTIGNITLSTDKLIL